MEAKIRTMEEFASACGVSRPTVSKFFNDPKSVRQSTRARIEAAIERFEYRPNIYAINQNRQQTKVIGLVVPNLIDPFFAGIARKIEGMLVDAGFNPILLSSHRGPDVELDNLDSLRALKPAGVLLAPLGRASRREGIAEFTRDFPTVLFDAYLDEVGAAFFGSDNAQSIGLMVDYLCRSGEPPAFFEMKTPINPNAFRRRSAYMAAMERLGQTPQLIQIDGEGWDFESIGFEGGKRLLARRDLGTNTILCSNDRLAIGLLSAAFESGLRVGLGSGSALRIAGHDDHPFSRFTCPSLTTVSQDYDAIAKNSVDALLGIVESGEFPASRQVKLFEGKLILRGSA